LTAKIDRRSGKTYLTMMNARTIMSGKGQVVIPKDVRDRLGFVPGERLDVIEMAGGVLLKASPRKVGRSIAEVLAEVHAIVDYHGPILSVEDMTLTDDDLRELTKDSCDRAGD
jgi:AbrB family looped-hinge helix DNA binding protein